MKTILFLGRSRIAHQFALMAPHMRNVNIIFVAYSQEVVGIWESYGIKANYVYLDLFKEEYDKCVVYDEALFQIDKDIIEQSQGRFNLNSSIQSDRGFSLLSYEEGLR